MNADENKTRPGYCNSNISNLFFFLFNFDNSCNRFFFHLLFYSMDKISKLFFLFLYSLNFMSNTIPHRIILFFTTFKTEIDEKSYSMIRLRFYVAIFINDKQY